MTTPARPSASPFLPEHHDLESLRSAAATCKGCELWEPATQTVFGRGATGARLVLVGEQPGDVEDQKGVPFVGPAGHLLVRALDEAGVNRSQVWVTNSVKHFRFTVRGKRRIHQSPEAAHVAACKPWLEAEIATVDPRLTVALGATAAKALLGSAVRVTKDRGHVMTRSDSTGRERDFLVTIHPSAILRTPDEERPAAYAALVADLAIAAGAVRE